VNADIGGGFIADDAPFMSEWLHTYGVNYTRDEIFYHELLARLGLPHA